MAALGAVANLYSAMTLTVLSDEFDEADTAVMFGITAYSYLSGFACLAGIFGVLKVTTYIPNVINNNTNTFCYK